MEPKHLDHDDELGCKISKIKLSGDKLAHLDEKSTPSASPSSIASTGKDDVAEAKLDLEVEREWKLLQNEAGTGKIEIANNPRARKIAKGLVMCVRVDDACVVMGSVANEQKCAHWSACVFPLCLSTRL